MAPLFFCLQSLSRGSMFRDNPAYRVIAFPGFLFFTHLSVKITQEIPSPGIIRLPLGYRSEFLFCKALFSTLPVKLAGEYVCHVTISQQLFLPLESQVVARCDTTQPLQDSTGIAPRLAGRIDRRLIVRIKNVPADLSG